MSEHGVTSIEEILDQVTAFWRSAVLWSATDLHLADHIVAGRDTASAIAAAEDADERAVARILNALCAMGFADKEEDGRYTLEPLVASLLPTQPGSLGEAAPIWLNEFMWTAWGSLPRVVRTGAPLDETGIEHPFWELFARSSFGISQLQGAQDVDAVKPPEGARIVDVGCGSGGVGYAFAAADPTATVTGVDGEAVLDIAAENARALGIVDRVTHRVADITAIESFGDHEFDVAIVSHILHHCDRDAAPDLLAKISRALVPGGRIVINEFVADEGRKRETFALLFGVMMMLNSPGDTYTLSEIGGWLTACGFEDITTHDLLGRVTAIVATKTDAA